MIETEKRGQAIERVLRITLGMNALAAAVKLAAGWSIGSLALLAGGLDAASDAAANVAGIVGIRAANRPPDPDHPYGHRKLETLVAGIIAGGLFVSAGRMAWSAVTTLGNPPDIQVSTLALAAPLVALAINVVTATYEGRAAKRLGSELLEADAAHTWTDAAVSVSLLVGLLAVRSGYAIVDPVLALIIAAVVARVGWSIAVQASDILADSVAIDPSDLAAIVGGVAGVEGVHKIRSRGPLDHVSVDLHIQVDPDLGIRRAHAIGHAVSDALQASVQGIEDVVVHVEPAERPGGGERTQRSAASGATTADLDRSDP